MKKQGLEIQQQRLAALADRVSSGQATAAERLELQRERLAFDKAKLEQQQQGSTTTIEQPLGQDDTAIALADIANEASKLGVKTSDDIKKIAARRGLVLEGEPTLEKPGALLGFGGKPTLTGDFTIGRKPKVTTKTPQGREPAPAGGAPGTVMMEAPDGSKRAVPADRVDEFKKKGAKVVGR